MPIGSARSRQKKIIIILVLVVLILAAYWQVQNFEFINYDDQDYVTSNYRIQSAVTLKSIIGTFTDTHTGNWHPLTMLSHMLDWQLFGEKAGGHHWTSVIIHIFNTVLLFLLLNQLTGAIWRSALVAALFAVHPINVESVAWIAERKNVLSTFFWILTMLLYVWYVKQPGWKRYLPVFLCFALGLMSKPMLVTLPFVLLLLDYWPLNRTAINTQNENQTAIQAPLKVGKAKLSFLILEKIPLFILTVISICVTLYTQHNAKAVVNLDSLPILKRINNAIVSYGLYIKKMFWPIELSVFYPLYKIDIWQLLVESTLLVILTIIVLNYYRKYPYLLVGWFWYLGTLVPVIGLVQVGAQSMADRYAYVPFIGLFIMIVWSGNQILSKVPSKIIFTSILFVVIISTLEIVTYKQVGLWKNTKIIFDDVLKRNPDNFQAHNALGLFAASQGDNDKALYYYYKAIEINPKYERAYVNAGIILVKTDKIKDAICYFEKALQINDKFFDAHYNLGTALLSNNLLEGALLHFNKALETNPDHKDALNNLAITLMKLGKENEAIIIFNKMLQLNPDDYRAQQNLKIAVLIQKNKK